MTDIPDIVIWAIVFAVIVQGFSMALLVYLMYHKRKDEKKTAPPLENPPEEESGEKP